MSTPSEPYDFFVSYAREDNTSGWIARFVEALQEEQRRFTGGRDFRVFFDKSDIRSLDDWRHRIYESLAASRLLVAFISPNYFASEMCRKEWRTWIDVEIAKHVLSEGTAPIYIVEVPWLAGAMSEQQVAECIARLSPKQGSTAAAQDVIGVSGQVSKRNYTKAHAFYRDGLDALRREDLRKVLASLAKDLSCRSEHVQAAAKSRSTIPPYNRRFVGRLEELTLLRERLHQGRTGVISGHKGDLPEDKTVIASVHGLGGIGKTELAFTYAHAFAGLYPGGRFLVPCDGRSDLRQAMLALDEIFLADISDEQRKALDLHFGAIRDCLRRRLHEIGRILLVLDNVTDAALLNPEQTDFVRALGPELHLLATTRLGAPEGGGTFDDVHWLTLGELGFEDSLRLLEKHRAFSTPAERAAAESIARRLGGFALCLEVVGAYLGQHLEQSYAQFLGTMGLEDLAPVDLAAERRDVVTRRHNNEKRLRAILDHTLRELTPEAMNALQFASLLQPEHIVLPWLSKLVGVAHPALKTDTIAWQRLIARLVSLALFARGDNGEAQALDESHHSRVLRCHRLLQEYLRGKSAAAETTARQTAVDTLIIERANALYYSDGALSAWELHSLFVTIPFLLNHSIDPSTLANAAVFLSDRARPYRGIPAVVSLLQSALQSQQRAVKANPDNKPLLRDVATTMQKLGDLSIAANDRTEAERLYNEAQRTTENLIETNPSNFVLRRDLSVDFEKRGNLAKTQGDLATAWQLHFESLSIRKQLALDDPNHADRQHDLLASFGWLGGVARTRGDFSEAERLYDEQLKIVRLAIAREPDNTKWQSAKAIVLDDLGDVALARKKRDLAFQFFEESWHTREKLVSADSHNNQWQLHLSISLSKLGDVEVERGNMERAKKRFSDGLRIAKKIAEADETNSEWQHQLAISYERLGDLVYDQGQPAEACDLYSKWLAVRQSQIQADPRNAEWQASLMICHNRIARCNLALQRHEEAEIHLQKSANIAERLKSSGAQVGQDLDAFITEPRRYRRLIVYFGGLIALVIGALILACGLAVWKFFF